METIFPMADEFGTFLADGPLGNEFRFKRIEPIWDSFDLIIFDFEGVDNMTDSFANGCFGNLAMEHPDDFRDKVRLRNCSELLRGFLAPAVGNGLREGRRIA